VNREDLGLGLLIVVALAGGYAMQWAGQPPQYLTHGMDAYQPPPDVVVELPAPVVDVSEDVRAALKRLENKLETRGATFYSDARAVPLGGYLRGYECPEGETCVINAVYDDIPTAAEIANALSAVDVATISAIDAVDNYVDTEIATCAAAVGSFTSTTSTLTNVSCSQ
jgi:hypothetical protein